ncbi:MAG: CopD family protein [Burkholderiales bacterium]|nr:CopD family protein [Burkholderiales bacterium]MDE2275275.1 CopD family protein [Burkholderiales bacterium]
MGEGGLLVLLRATAVVANAGLALALGALASRLWLRGADSAWARQVSARARQALGAGVLLAALASGGRLWFEAAAMAGTSIAQAGPMALTMAWQTHLGQAWLAGLAALAVAGAVACTGGIGRGRPGALALAGLSLAAYACTRSAVSHAGDAGDLSLPVAMNGLHQLLAGLWLGVVLTAALFAAPPAVSGRAAAAADRADAARWALALSTTATLALAGIALTGLYNAWRAAGSVAQLPALLHSDYGRILLVKLALVGLAVLMGGFNRWRVMPRLLQALRSAGGSAEGAAAGGAPEAAAHRHFMRVLRAEAGVLTLVLVAAVVLGSSAPPGAG